MKYIKPKYAILNLTKKQLARIELALRVDTPRDKKDAILLSSIQRKINILLDLM